MNIAFIGLGHMGRPMSENLLKVGHNLTVFDLNPAPVNELIQLGATAAKSAQAAVKGADVVISMLPEGPHVRGLYLDDGGIMDLIPKEALVLECSTIDMSTTQTMHEEADKRGLALLDAPVSGGVTGAQNATLTFMVGGSHDDYKRAHPLFEVMGKKIVHCGGAGTGQAAKICNNMVLGVTMIASSEAFLLAEKLGLSKEKFFEVASESSAQNWSITSYCPVPDLVPTSPANRNYEAGFTADMMLKDLKLAVDAAEKTGASCPMGAEAMSLYSLFCDTGQGVKDFSGIIRWISGKIS